MIINYNYIYIICVLLYIYINICNNNNNNNNNNMYNVYIKHQGKTKHQDGDQIPALFQTALLGPTCLLGLCLVHGGAFLPVGSRGLVRRFPKMVPNMDDLYWFIIENPTKMDDEQGYPYFRKPPNIVWLSFKQYFFFARAPQRICPTTLPASSRRQGLPVERDMKWES